MNPLHKLTKPLHSAPREIIFSPIVLFSSFLYASAAVPLSWDQGSASTIASLPGFGEHFGISSGANAAEIKNIVALVYAGDAAGAALSLLVNDRVGRRWAFRLYTSIWIIGYLIAILSPNTSALYAARVISGLGIGALSVTGPMSIAEIAPPETRGLLSAWYTVCQLLALMCANFCAYGVELHLAENRLQYQILWIAPIVFMSILIAGSFTIPESPRWLALNGRFSETQRSLVQLRRLPAEHPRVKEEFESILATVGRDDGGVSEQAAPGVRQSIKETFATRSNRRRLQQAIILYALPQLSGGNSITNYFIPIVEIVGAYKNRSHGLLLSSMYSLAKFFYALIASFLLIDVVGRRKSLFIGASIQMVSYVYLAAYIYREQKNEASLAAGEAGLAFVFIAAFGYTAGLLTLPYVFGGELWPNRIRSSAAAIAQTFHWLFHFAMTYAVPALLDRSNNWGGFVFFAVWCFVALLYVYLLVPETAGLSVEDIEDVFSGPVLIGRWTKGKREVFAGEEERGEAVPTLKAAESRSERIEKAQ